MEVNLCKTCELTPDLCGKKEVPNTNPYTYNGVAAMHDM